VRGLHRDGPASGENTSHLSVGNKLIIVQRVSGAHPCKCPDSLDPSLVLVSLARVRIPSKICSTSRPSRGSRRRTRAGASLSPENQVVVVVAEKGLAEKKTEGVDS